MTPVASPQIQLAVEEMILFGAAVSIIHKSVARSRSSYASARMLRLAAGRLGNLTYRELRFTVVHLIACFSVRLLFELVGKAAEH